MGPVSRIQLMLPNTDGQRKIWFFIEPSIETISDLMQSMQAKLSVSEACTLYLEDAILPPYETIQILRDGEAVRLSCNEHGVSVVKETAGKKKRKRKEQEVAEPAEADDRTAEVLAKKKRKTLKKDDESNSAQTEIVESVVPATVVNESPEAKTSEESGVDADVRQKRRRRRHHKKKTKEVDEFIHPIETANILPSPVPVVRQSHRANHIRFVEEEETIEEESITVEEPMEARRILVDTPDSSINPLAALTSLKSAVFVRSPSAVPPPRQLAGKTKEPDTSNFVFQPENYAPLTSQPRPGDVVAFKVLELGENYTPRLSEYYQAQVTSVSPFGDISLSLRNKPSGNLNKNGKFELVWDEEGDWEPSSSNVTYQWSELVEPRLLSC